ncbi:MAG: hypothetical protein ACE5FC_06495 [Myxococcota bacterium]
MAAVRDLGLFRGVEIHEEYLREKPPGEDREAWVAAGAAGTDYALNFGRTLFSAKLPVTRPMLEKMIAYLNGLNLKYASDQADYNWSGYADNCVHTIHNSLAAAGIWRPWPVAAIKLLNLFNLAVPANEFIDLATLANEFPLESFSRIYFDRVKRRELWEYGWLPTRHGALLETIPVHRDNALYDTGFKMLVLEPAFIFGRTRRRGNRMLDDPRYTDIGENLRYFRARYERILEEGRAWRDRTLREMRYRIARRKYYAYIEAQIEDADRKLAQLGKEGA